MQAMAISSDFRAFNFLVHFLQIWAVRPLPENFSFARIFLHTLQKCPRYRFFFAIVSPPITYLKPQKIACQKVTLTISEKIKRDPPPHRRENFHAL